VSCCCSTSTARAEGSRWSSRRTFAHLALHSFPMPFGCPPWLFWRRDLLSCVVEDRGRWLDGGRLAVGSGQWAKDQ
jgi:hypothetical protein